MGQTDRVGLPYILARSGAKVKRKILIAEISVLDGEVFARVCYVTRYGFDFMKLAGLLLLLAGWLLVLTAVVLLPHDAASQGAFVLAGMGVETLALVLLFRAHWVRPRRRE